MVFVRFEGLVALSSSRITPHRVCVRLSAVTRRYSRLNDPTRWRAGVSSFPGIDWEFGDCFLPLQYAPPSKNDGTS